MALITVDELRKEGRFTTGEFDWDNWADDFEVDTWLAQVVTRASIRVQQAVGAANYASADTVVHGSLEDAEMSMAMALCLRRVIRILGSRPEEAPPPAYIDLTQTAALMATYEADFNELVAPYRIDSTRTPGLAFGFIGVGVAETAAAMTTTDDADYGDLEDYS